MASFLVNRRDDFTVQALITGDEVPKRLPCILVILSVRVGVPLEGVAVFAINATIDGDDLRMAALAQRLLRSFKVVAHPVHLVAVAPIRARLDADDVVRPISLKFQINAFKIGLEAAVEDIGNVNGKAFEQVAEDSFLLRREKGIND